MKTVPTSQHGYNAAITTADMMLEISRQLHCLFPHILQLACTIINTFFLLLYFSLCLINLSVWCPVDEASIPPQGFSNHQCSCTTKLVEKQKDDTYAREKEQKNCSTHLFYLVFIFYWHQMSLVPLEADTSTAAVSTQKCPPWAWEKPKLRGSRPCNPLGATNSETLSLFYGLE